jgi:hypothetical protein
MRLLTAWPETTIKIKSLRRRVLKNSYLVVELLALRLHRTFGSTNSNVCRRSSPSRYLEDEPSPKICVDKLANSGADWQWKNSSAASSAGVRVRASGALRSNISIAALLCNIFCTPGCREPPHPRPIVMHRLHCGLFSSHFTRRILKSIQYMFHSSDTDTRWFDLLACETACPNFWLASSCLSRRQC